MSSTPVPPDNNQGTSTRPYLIRALHDWCTDNGFTPYVAVYVDRSVQVPMEYVKNHEIVLNVGFEATSGLKLGNEFIEFRARFGGSAREIIVPVDHVVAIYARENGQGMAFPVPADLPASGGEAAASPRGVAGPGLRLASREPTEATPPVASVAGRTPVPVAGSPSDGDPAAAPSDSSDDQPDGEPPQPPPVRPTLKRVK